MGSVLFGGAMAGLGGAYLSLAHTPLWVENMTAGRGWIALALVVFASWRPWRAFFGAYLFGGITIIQLHAQGFGIAIPSQFMAMLPYLATVIVLVLISRDVSRVRLNAPACLGKSFYASG
jgi:simple sugar transport system permease protein